jgi:NAD(P)-dependent dehydrogenase (short-subunit alcohol dehydrogenase family)
LLWLGANVVIAEVNSHTGVQAAEKLGSEWDPDRVLFVQTDVGDEASVSELAARATRRFGKVDAVINNATIAVLGTVKDLPIDKWDASYRVNLRGPVLMARAFLPGMLGRRHGAIVCVSSKGPAFLGGYETFKAAQVHLADTLDAELEGTGVYAFTIGPGLVPTDTLLKAVEKLAPLMGMTAEEFFSVNKSMILSVEEAGAGFAAALVFAEKYHGQEVSSFQALADAGFHQKPAVPAAAGDELDEDRRCEAVSLCAAVRKTLLEQSEGWKARSLFERQWVVRDFKKTAGMPLEEWLKNLERLEESLRAGETVTPPPLEKLAVYYDHLAELAKGYEKDASRLEESLRHLAAWKDEVEKLECIFGGSLPEA